VRVVVFFAMSARIAPSAFCRSPGVSAKYACPLPPATAIFCSSQQGPYWDGTGFCRHVADSVPFCTRLEQ
jgi:hypothetical protein